MIALVEYFVTGDLSACVAVFLAHVLPVVMLKHDRTALQPRQ